MGLLKLERIFNSNVVHSPIRDFLYEHKSEWSELAPLVYSTNKCRNVNEVMKLLSPLSPYNIVHNVTPTTAYRGEFYYEGIWNIFI